MDRRNGLHLSKDTKNSKNEKERLKQSWLNKWFFFKFEKDPSKKGNGVRKRHEYIYIYIYIFTDIIYMKRVSGKKEWDKIYLDV